MLGIKKLEIYSSESFCVSTVPDKDEKCIEAEG
jgi:hypothetical protein